MSEATPVAVNILDREFLIGCTAEERAGLIAAAGYLDGKMREVRGSSRTQGLDRIAVMAALNIAHELLQARQNLESESGVLAQHLQAMRAKLDAALAPRLK
ncbi:MAG TPA: cell division protein ZapA [Rudaea sp.]|nr:cell division protein ZapA [Rudaea sp.]